MTCLSMSVTKSDQSVRFGSLSGTQVVYLFETMPNKQKKSGFKRFVRQLCRRILWTSARGWRKMANTYGQYSPNDRRDGDNEEWALVVESKPLFS